MSESNRRFHKTSRTTENFTEEGLKSLTGQPRGKWGQYVVKETIDNSLEAGENVTIMVAVETNGEYPQRITIRDDGPGIPRDRLDSIFEDVTKFAGTKRHYKLPTRGNQGNALMTILGIQHVVNDQHPLKVHSQGRKYTIRVTKDQISGEYTVNIQDAGSSGTDGFAVTVNLGDQASHYASRDAIEAIVARLALLNPQAGFRLDVDGEIKAHTPLPDSTVNPFTAREKVTWFSFDDFQERLQADARTDSSMTVREFIQQFQGFKTKHKTVLADVDIDGDCAIRELFRRHEDTTWYRELYDNIITETGSYAESGLDSTIGSVGKDLKERLLVGVGNGPKVIADRHDDNDVADVNDLAVYYGDGKVVKYNSKTVPFYFELAAVPTKIRESNENSSATVVFGVNQSVLYSTPKFRPHLEVKHTNGFEQYDGLQAAFDFGHDFMIIANLMCPTVDFSDKGKQQLDTTPFTSVIEDVVGKAVRKIERDVRPRLNELRTDTDLHPQTLPNKAPNDFFKRFVQNNFDEVYDEATDNGRFALEMRQFYYAMRPRFEEAVERERYEYSPQASLDNPKSLELEYETFTNNVDRYEEEVLGERIILRDERGFFVEPHTNNRIELGTTAVNRYEPDISQYGNLLFVEKTGFHDLIHEQFELTRRYDIGLINAKGWNTIAGRNLIETIQRENPDATVYTLTDMDIAGVGIAADSKNPDALSDVSEVDELDTVRLGVTLDDIEEYGLPIEESPDYSKKQRSALESRYNNGDIDEDTYEFLRANGGQRVEINAFSPVELKDYLETQFDEHGIEKVKPDSPEEVQTPSLPDPEETRNDAIEQGLGRWLMQQIPNDVRESVRDNVTPTDESTDMDGFNVTASDLHDDIIKQLSDRPSKHWTDINNGEVERREEEAERIQKDYEEMVIEDALTYLNDNHTVTVD